jgi:hypothetical protein
MALFCRAWAMPAIASLALSERVMSMQESHAEEVSSAPPAETAQEPEQATPAAAEAAAPEATAASSAQAAGEVADETNGGPLGCCLGVIIGLLLSLSVAIVARLLGSPLTDLLHGTLLRVIMALFALVGAIICGYFGWKIGRRIYREYELSPRQRRRLAELERKYARRR